MVLFTLTEPARTVPVKTVPEEMKGVQDIIQFGYALYSYTEGDRWIPWPLTGKQWSIA